MRATSSFGPVWVTSLSRLGWRHQMSCVDGSKKSYIIWCHWSASQPDCLSTYSMHTFKVMVDPIRRESPELLFTFVTVQLEIAYTWILCKKFDELAYNFYSSLVANNFFYHRTVFCKYLATSKTSKGHYFFKTASCTFVQYFVSLMPGLWYCPYSFVSAVVVTLSL